MNLFKYNDARVESDKIGNGTLIWAFSHVLPGAVIGECVCCFAETTNFDLRPYL